MRVACGIAILLASFAHASVIELEWTMPDGRVERERRNLVENDGVATFALTREEIASRGAWSLAVTPDFARARKGDDGFWVFSSGECGTFRCDEGKAECRRWQLMSVYGMKTPERTFAAIVKKLKYYFTTRVTAKDGEYRMSCVLEKELCSRPYEDFEIEFRRLDGGEATMGGIARAYRRYQLERGAVKPLRERAASNSVLKDAIDGPEIRIRQAWKPVPPKVLEQTLETEPPVTPYVTFDRVVDIARELKAAGVEKAELCLVGWNIGGHDGRWPQSFPAEPVLGGDGKLKECVKAVRGMGYLIVPHGNYLDAYSIADSWDEEWLAKTFDGGFLTSGNWGGGKSARICAQRAYERFASRDMWRMGAYGFKGLGYFDVVSIVPADECQDPRHPLNRADAARWWGRGAALSKRVFGGFASEGAFDHFVEDLDSALYVSFNDPRRENAGLVDRMAPFPQLVYNGVFAMNPFTRTVNFTAQERYWQLKLIEFGGRPTFYFYSKFKHDGKNWMGDGDLGCATGDELKAAVAKIKAGYDVYMELSHLQYEFMEEHDDLGGGVWRTTYSNGERLYVNYSDMTANADGLVIPAKGWRLARGFTAHSMVTHDGRRLVSHLEGTNTVYELVPTNQLPAGLPPVREWKLYGLKATHTDIGLHNSQYIQRHGTVKRIDEAARLIDADTRTDDDPAAYRYVMEGFWFWDNYHMDKGMDAAWRIVTNYVARGRMDVGVTCAGNHTHLFSETETERSTLTKKILATKWGIGTKTFIMADNPGISCSVVAPYLRAGIKYGLFLPNQWNPISSTIWKKNASIIAATWNPDAMGGGSRVEVSYSSPLPMVFRWKAPGRDESLLMWCSTQYDFGYSRLGMYGRKRSAVDEVEKLMPKFLCILEGKYPYDIWLAAIYGDDELPNTNFADFAAEWNAKWAWPQFRTVGRLDEPFEYLEKNFGDKIPTLSGEMTGGWLQHAASTPELLADKLNADRMLETAERLGTFAGTIDRAAVDRAWWYLILNDEHSYGTSGYQGRRVFETWMQKRDWIERAAATASSELSKAVRKLGLFTNDNCHNCSQITNTNVAFTTGSLGVSENDASAQNFQDSRTPSSESNINPVKDGVSESRWYRVVVTNGVIYSIYDKELNRELIDGPANKFLYTRDNHKTWESDPETALGAKVTRSVYLPDDVKRIDIVDMFEHARDLFNSRRYYRYGYLAFPFAVPSGRFAAHLNGTVIRPYEDCHPMTTDAYCAVRDWCAVENDDFGVALMMRDSTLTEFGEIHPDKTCYTGRPPEGKTAIYPYLFTDWLQMHQPDGDSLNFTFRFAITSYAKKTGREALVVERAARPFPEDRNARAARSTSLCGGEMKGIIENHLSEISRMCEDWLDPYAKWMRAHNVPHVTRETVAEPPPGWTGLIEKPRAGHGEKDGQMYVLWGAETSPDFDHYELYRDGKFLSNVKNEIHYGIPYRVARYEDLGLSTHSRHEYRLRKVWKDGRKDELGEPFFGLTRYVSEEERNGIVCEGEHGRMYVRYDGATVTSWQPGALKGREAFFMQKNAPWGKEVHGGLPICWPWFGKREGCPKHGLARYLKWRLVNRVGKDGVVLETSSTPETMKVWPHAFKLTAKIFVAGPNGLRIAVTETNTGKTAYESAFGVHPYFVVADACDVMLDGERLPKPWVIKEFAADGKSHELQDFAGKVAYSVMSSGNDTWYVWNPGVERTPLCETLGPDEWRRFFCLEPFMRQPITLAPGESREHVVKISVKNAE